MKGHRQIRNTRQRGRDRADAQVARKAAPETAIPGAWCAHRRRDGAPTSSTRSPSGVKPRNGDLAPPAPSRGFLPGSLPQRRRSAASRLRLPPRARNGAPRKNEQEFKLIEHGWAPRRSAGRWPPDERILVPKASFLSREVSRPIFCKALQMAARREHTKSHAQGVLARQGGGMVRHKSRHPAAKPGPAPPLAPEKPWPQTLVLKLAQQLA